MIGRCSSMKGSREDTVRTSMCSYEWPKFHAFVSGWVIFHLIGQVQGKPWNSQCVTNVNPRSWLPHLLLLLGHSVMSDYLVTLWTVARQVPPSMGLSRQEYLSGCHFLLQGIFLTQGLNPCLLPCRRFFTAEPPEKLPQLVDFWSLGFNLTFPGNLEGSLSLSLFFFFLIILLFFVSTVYQGQHATLTLLALGCLSLF